MRCISFILFVSARKLQATRALHPRPLLLPLLPARTSADSGTAASAPDVSSFPGSCSLSSAAGFLRLSCPNYFVCLHLGFLKRTPVFYLGSWTWFGWKAQVGHLCVIGCFICPSPFTPLFLPISPLLPSSSVRSSTFLAFSIRFTCYPAVTTYPPPTFSFFLFRIPVPR